jgi:hypothetical protein
MYCGRHEAKASRAQTLKKFTSFHFVLGVHFYLISAAVMIIVLVAPLLCSLFLASPVYTTSPGTSVFPTTRCEWWTVPGNAHSCMNLQHLRCTLCTFLHVCTCPCKNELCVQYVFLLQLTMLYCVIIEEYTTATSNSSLCGCIRARFFEEVRALRVL